MLGIATINFVLLLIYCSVRGEKENIILFLTDDQDLVLGGLSPMKKAKSLIGQNGASFQNAFSTTPLCCPSRSSILTGSYQHNHRVLNNSFEGGCNGFEWQSISEPKSFAVHLSDAGYKTFYAGKYLNRYGSKISGGARHIPKGWHSWYGLIGNSRYYNYSLSVNGREKKFRDKYLTNLIEEYSLKFLDEVNDNEPFLMVLAPPAPHHPFTPEPKYTDVFDIKIPRNKQFNYANNSDKHWLIRMKPSPLPEGILNILDKFYSRRWETLLSVDDLIHAVITKLQSKKLLDKTYIILTSDHGFHLGQFSLTWDKRQMYDFDLRVPFLIRGPGIPRNVSIESPLLNIDIAPTLLHIAGIKKVSMDGISLLPLKKRKSRSFLIEYRGERSNHRETACPGRDLNLYGCSLEAGCKCQDAVNNTYICIRSLGKSDFVFCEFKDNEGFKEMYDLKKDPQQLYNIVKSMDPQNLTILQEKLNQMAQCEGISCHNFYRDYSFDTFNFSCTM